MERHCYKPLNPSAPEFTSVMVVGGGPVGLAAAAFLAYHKINVVLVERRRESMRHPRAVGWTVRTMELFRQLEIAHRFPENAAVGAAPGRIRVESLSGEWFETSKWTPRGRADSPGAEAEVDCSPHRGCRMPQDELEPILRQRALELGADIRFGVEMTGFENDMGGVTACLRRGDGSERLIRADYLIAADGNRSAVREALGIGLEGKGYLQTMRSVMFRPELGAELVEQIERLRATGVVQFSIDQPDFKGMLGGGYAGGRWILYLSDDQERTEAELKDAVNRAIGTPGASPEIVTTGRWEVTACIATSFSAGRVFLMGDAAHTLPPNRGGYGANTGIEDAHNLAWKLQAVISGTSLPSLLDTYDTERRPIAWLRHQQIFNRPDYAAYAGEAVLAPVIDDLAMELGQLYRSSAIVGAGEELPPALRPDQWNGQPGTRAPHLWLANNAGRRSILDLFGRDWVLLAEDESWRVAAERWSDGSGLRLVCHIIGADLVATSIEDFRHAFGVGAKGSVLIRPDGFIAWRSVDGGADLAGMLAEAISRAAALVI